MSDCENLREPLDDLFKERGWDYGVKLDTAAECMWGCEVRITPRPNQHGVPDRSFVTLSVGGSPEEVMARAVADAVKWVNSSKEALLDGNGI